MSLETNFPRDLDVKLTPDEINEKSEQLARTVDDLEKLREDKAKAVRAFSTQIKDKERRLRELARNVTKGEEMRPVLTSERYDVRRFQVETFRHDNHAVIETRAMTKEELEDARQGSLFGDVRPVRIADPKANDPAVSTPDATDAPPTNGAIATAPPADDAADDTVITDPDGLQDGSAAKRAAKNEKKAAKKAAAATRKKRGGLNVGGPEGEEMPPATPGTVVGAALIVDQPADAPAAAEPEGDSQCASRMKSDDPTSVRCVRTVDHDGEHEGSGITWTDDHEADS